MTARLRSVRLYRSALYDSDMDEIIRYNRSEYRRAMCGEPGSPPEYKCEDCGRVECFKCETCDNCVGEEDNICPECHADWQKQDCNLCCRSNRDCECSA